MTHERVQLLGIAELDDDHVRLASIVAELELCAENRGQASEAGRIAARLLEAAKAHFAREEQLMEESKYPGLAQHREIHANLIHFIGALANELAAGYVQVDEQLIASVWEWELEHIDTTDKEYADYVRQKGTAAGH